MRTERFLTRVELRPKGEIQGCISSSRVFRFRLHKQPGGRFMDDNQPVSVHKGRAIALAQGCTNEIDKR